MRLNIAVGLIALFVQPVVFAWDRNTFCDLERNSPPSEVNCRIDVSAPAGGGTSPELSRKRIWRSPEPIHFQICNEWDSFTADRNRDMTFAEIDFTAPDKPDIKGLLVLSAQQIAVGHHNEQYLVIDWFAPAPVDAGALNYVPIATPMAVAQITDCPVITDPFMNIGTDVKIRTISLNEIAVLVNDVQVTVFKARLASTKQVSATQLRIMPFIYDYNDKSVIRTLWFRPQVP